MSTDSIIHSTIGDFYKKIDKIAKAREAKRHKIKIPIIQEITLWNGKVKRIMMTRSKAIKIGCQKCFNSVSARKCVNESCQFFYFRPGKKKEEMVNFE